MSFVKPQRNPGRQAIGIGIAIVFHIVLVWALMNGLARKVVQAISDPIETRIVEEIKPPPPPPKPIELPPPPKFTPPPPAFVPPPEVKVEAPPVAAPTIATTTAEPPPAPAAVPVAAPPAPPAPPAPVAPPRPVSASVACSNYATVMGETAFPREASRLGLEEGSAVIEFTLTSSGELRDVHAVKASHPVFAANSIRLVNQYKCAGVGRDVTVRVPFTYQSE